MSHQTPSWSLRPVDTWLGLCIALLIMAAWATLLIWSLFVASWSQMWWLVPIVLVMQTFLYTGLFITAHDAMHGVVCYRWPKLNTVLGTLAVWVYALFSFTKLKSRHWAHHGEPGTEHDPDFHEEGHPGFFRWYGRFLSHYMTFWQIAGMALIFNVLAHGLNVAEWKLIVLWVIPSILSTFQLFYFGTYLPHRRSPLAPFVDDHRARSNALPTWLSFLTCYHFGYHWEHHAYPSCPWWRLPQLRHSQTTRVTHA